MLSAEFNAELAEKPGGASSGYGPDAKRKEAIMETMNDRLVNINKSMTPLIADLNNDISKYVDEKNKEIANIDKSVSGLDGLAESNHVSRRTLPSRIMVFNAIIPCHRVNAYIFQINVD